MGEASAAPGERTDSKLVSRNRICVSDVILLSALLLRMQPDGEGGAAALAPILGDLGRAALGRLRGDGPGVSWTLDFAATGLRACRDAL